MYDHIRKVMIVAMLSTGAMGVWAQSQIEGHLARISTLFSDSLSKHYNTSFE
jgi:hypothetical protein